jgi:23S rRNA pseudouridine1911/1915/1917 synthase
MPRPKKTPLTQAGRGATASKSQEKSLPRVRPVHRLDRDTSGVMVFARTPEAETHLVQQFKKHSIERRYHAIVYGQVTQESIESRIVRDRGDGLRGSTEIPGEGDRAVTHIKPLEVLGKYSLIECRLETGRTHQIRIHLSEDGHTLCGETTYVRDRKTGKKIIDKSGAPRLALHAQHLAFDHPLSKHRISFDAPLPRDLQAFLDRLRKQASS